MKTTTLALVERATGVLHAAKISLRVSPRADRDVDRACGPVTRDLRIVFAA